MAGNPESMHRGRGRGSSDRLAFDAVGNGDYGGPVGNLRASSNNPVRGNQGPGHSGMGPGQRPHMGRPEEGHRPHMGRPEEVLPGHVQIISNLKTRIREVRKGYDDVNHTLTLTRQQVQDLQARQRQQDKSHGFDVKRFKDEADYHKRLRLAAESRAAAAEEQLARFERHAQGVDEAQTGLIQETQVLLSQKTELQTKLKQAESELAMQREMVTQLAMQLESLQGENAELRDMYDKMMAEGQSMQLMQHNPTWNDEEEYDTDGLYVSDSPYAGEREGYIGTGTGEDGPESSPGEGSSPVKVAPATDG